MSVRRTCCGFCMCVELCMTSLEGLLIPRLFLLLEVSCGFCLIQFNPPVRTPPALSKMVHYESWRRSPSPGSAEELVRISNLTFSICAKSFSFLLRNCQVASSEHPDGWQLASKCSKGPVWVVINCYAGSFLLLWALTWWLEELRMQA